MQIVIEPLTARGFAPFGEVLSVPADAGRTYFDQSLANLRTQASPSLSLAHKDDIASLPFRATQMERHEFSSQTFVPIEAGPWLTMVAPHATGGGPDMTRARAFLAGPGQGVTYGANVWHHPLTIFERPASFAIFMWLTRGPGDEEFFSLQTPVTITRA